MFAVRVRLSSIRSSHVAVRSLAVVNNRHEHPKQLPLELEKVTTIDDNDNDDVVPSCGTTNFISTMGNRPTGSSWSSTLRRFQTQCRRTYSTEAAGKADSFGDLGDRRFEKVEMDEGELAEEKFVENEARVFRRHRLTPGGYANLIKSHIQKRDLDAALRVLQTVKENRDKPTAYMFNLLLRAFAVAGNFKKCRSLYAMMKKRGLECNAATYTSILNACANYHHSPTALEYLENLREEFMEKNIVLNDTHYNAMIKAYGRHNQLLEAFKIADLMRDKKLPTGEVTFNTLLSGTISDRESGLRHALAIWHVMQRHRIKPTLTTYNLLLRAIRDTKLGDLKVNDSLAPSTPDVRIVVSDEPRPDLLNKQPTVRGLTLKRIAEQLDEIDKNRSEETIDEGSKNLPATVDDRSNEKSLITAEERMLATPLEKYHRKNRLVLFGGATGILDRMASDGVTPDTRTVTLLMELVPKSAAAENAVVKIARSKGVPLDIDFFNMLMKKRTMRKDYDGAKSVLDDIQRSGLCPDIITWGILAMGCETSEDARTLIDGMEMTGHRMNAVIAGTLIAIGCRKIRFGYVLEIMELMAKNKIKPNWELYSTLDSFQIEMTQMIKSRNFSRTVNHPAFKTGFAKFCMRYASWQKEMERKPENKSKIHKRS